MASTVQLPKGLLNPAAGTSKFRLTRHAPSPDLAFFVARYWIVEWDLRDQEPYHQTNIPHPCINLVIEHGQSSVYGVNTGLSSRTLQGRGRVFGVKFRPGAFYPFAKTPVCRLNDRTFPLEAFFNVESRALEQAVLSPDDPARMIQRMEEFLRGHLPARDEAVAEINRMVDAIMGNREITKVDDVAQQFAVSKRTLQRLFSRYVGVSPKWVIKRYRLHEAADRLAAGATVEWAKLAVSLGYFDQAHFIKDFKAMVGTTPADYARRLG
ncbi:MAG TPA: helix-turn-helix domain-containing protein [Caldilineaceae bacterium]|nr:helix-turn-helix domain-containing protein [Caldilineaceae bacterium]